MGLLRKTMSVATLGMGVRYKTNAQRRSEAMAAQGKAAKRTARADSKRAAAEARLLDAQADAVRRQAQHPADEQ